MKINLVGISQGSIKSSSIHSHNEWEIVLNLEGEGISVIGDKEYNFYPGTIFCQPPNISHSKTSKDKFKDIFIQVSDIIILSNETISIFIDDKDKSFETLMFLALHIFHKKEANYVSIVKSIYETMYQLLISWGENKSKNENVELFKNELIENFTNPEYLISTALGKTSYCNDHFRRCFKKDTGTNPVTYFINVKIEYSKKLLSVKGDTRMPISEISLLSGFYDSHYFSRVFKNKVGITPHNYMINKI